MDRSCPKSIPRIEPSGIRPGPPQERSLLGPEAAVEQAAGGSKKERVLPDQEADLGQDWILRAMIAMAGADRRLDTREVSLIQRTYQDFEGKTLTMLEIAGAANAYAKDGDLLGELAAAASGLDMETKEEIIRAAYVILLADDQIGGEERKKLQDIAAALKVPEIHFGAILEDLAICLTPLKS